MDRCPVIKQSPGATWVAAVMEPKAGSWPKKPSGVVKIFYTGSHVDFGCSVAKRHESPA